MAMSVSLDARVVPRSCIEAPPGAVGAYRASTWLVARAGAYLARAGVDLGHRGAGGGGGRRGAGGPVADSPLAGEGPRGGAEGAGGGAAGRDRGDDRGPGPRDQESAVDDRAERPTAG